MVGDLATEKSISSNPGALRMLRPASPNPVACRVNAAGFTKPEGEGFGRYRGTPATRNGRLNASRLPLLSVTLIIGLKGLPDCRFTIGDMVQPCTSRLANAPLALKGRTYVPLSTKRCRASKSESARSAERLR